MIPIATVLTISGKKVRIDRPSLASIDAYDIAHHLSRLPVHNGATPVWHDLAARACAAHDLIPASSPRERLHALLLQAHAAYVGLPCDGFLFFDAQVCRQRRWEEFDGTVEAGWQLAGASHAFRSVAAIAQKAVLEAWDLYDDAGIPPAVRDAFARVVAREVREFFPFEDLASWTLPPPDGAPLIRADPDESRRQYLDRFGALASRRPYRQKALQEKDLR